MSIGVRSLSFLAFISVLVTALFPHFVFAAGERYSWESDLVISVNDGDLARTAELTRSSNQSVYSGTFHHSSGCDFSVQLTVGEGGSRGTLFVPSGSLSTPGESTFCSREIRESYSNSTVTINNVDRRQRSAPETEETQRVFVASFINVNREQIQGLTGSGIEQLADLSEVPETDTITLMTASRNVIDRKEINRIFGLFRYGTARFDGIVPGDYRVCSRVAENCVNFTKERGVRENIEISAQNAPIDIALGSDTDGGECEGTGVFGWILCPLLNDYLAPAVTALIEGPIQDFLFTAPITSNDTLREIWSRFRDFANVFFVVVFLVVIFSQATSFGLDTYSVKKMLPRLVIAAIGVQLSFFLVALMIDIFNVLGRGVYGLILSAGGQAWSFDVGSGAGGSLFQVTATIGAIAAVAYIGILTLVFVGFMLMLAIFATLSIRQLLILVLVITAPLAIVLWVLPNTESLSRRWLSYMGRVLFMYPMIMGLFALGGTASVLSTSIAEGSAGAFQEVFAKMIGIIAFFAPLFLIPFTFKFAGGVMAFAGGTIMGTANRFAKGRIAKGMERGRQGSKEFFAGQKFKGKYVGAGLNKVGGFLGAAPGLARSGPMGWVKPRSTMRAAMTEKRAVAGMAAAETEKLKAIQGDDNTLAAVGLGESFVNTKIAENQAIIDSADSSDEDKLAATTQIDAYKHALAYSRYARPSKAMQSAALEQLAATGFQLSEGEAGYQQLDAAARRITGGNEGERIRLMNKSQYLLRRAGRADLGGINNGAGYDPVLGYDKLTPYELGQVKPPTIRALSRHYQQELETGLGLIKQGDVQGARGHMDGAFRFLKEQRSVKPNATGAVAKAIEDVEAAYGSVMSSAQYGLRPEDIGNYERDYGTGARQARWSRDEYEASQAGGEGEGEAPQ